MFSACSDSSRLHLETESFSWTPKLKVAFQEQPIVSWEMTQFIKKFDENDSGLDTLVFASEINQESNLASYVQNAVNQLKVDGYSLSREKTKKTVIKGRLASHPAILKTYRIGYQDSSLEVSQLFIEQGNSVLMLSYASDDQDHTKVFSQELSSLHLNYQCFYLFESMIMTNPTSISFTIPSIDG